MSNDLDRTRYSMDITPCSTSQLTPTNRMRTFTEYANKRTTLKTLIRGIPVWFIDDALTIGQTIEQVRSEREVVSSDFAYGFQVVFKVSMNNNTFSLEEATIEKSPARIEIALSDISSISLTSVPGATSKSLCSTVEYVKVITNMGERFLLQPSVISTSTDSIPDSREFAYMLRILASNSCGHAYSLSLPCVRSMVLSGEDIHPITAHIT
eukprot:Tbor_TRINITY_DN5394_c0_g3::TRINITY_DN5394_c0_g3_i2::g.5211::m.5211